MNTCATCKYFQSFGEARLLGKCRGMCQLDEAITRSSNAGCRNWQAKRRPNRIRIARRHLTAA
jgi:hypothetical protein